MTITDAVIARMDELMAKKHISKKELAKASGIPRETITSVYKKLAKSITLATLKGLCDGLGVTMSKFLDSEYFTDGWLNSEDSQN
ncbi:MAG: helix-turn-helix transcriptional regulator [Bacteroidales bacterium]|nr:helix-turn-helix transcriptional regulator [Bacteroidales bacterium]